MSKSADERDAPPHELSEADDDCADDVPYERRATLSAPRGVRCSSRGVGAALGVPCQKVAPVIGVGASPIR